MKPTHITEEMLHQLNACDDSIDFITRNNLLPFPLSKVNDITDSEYHEWIKDNILDTHMELDDDNPNYLKYYHNPNYNKTLKFNKLRLTYYLVDTDYYYEEITYVYKYGKIIRNYVKTLDSTTIANYDDQERQIKIISINNNNKIVDIEHVTYKNNLCLCVNNTHEEITGSTNDGMLVGVRREKASNKVYIDCKKNDNDWRFNTETNHSITFDNFMDVITITKPHTMPIVSETYNIEKLFNDYKISLESTRPDYLTRICNNTYDYTDEDGNRILINYNKSGRVNYIHVHYNNKFKAIMYIYDHLNNAISKKVVKKKNNITEIKTHETPTTYYQDGQLKTYNSMFFPHK